MVNQGYKTTKYYEEWLAGQHGGHNTEQKGNWVYCHDCHKKFRVSNAPPVVEEI